MRFDRVTMQDRARARSGVHRRSQCRLTGLGFQVRCRAMSPSARDYQRLLVTATWLLAACDDSAVSDSMSAAVSGDANPAAIAPGSSGAAAEPPAMSGLAAKAPFVASGMPIMAPENTWTWVPFMDSRCRSGEPAGLSVNASFYTGAAGDVSLVEFFQSVLDGKPAIHAGH